VLPARACQDNGREAQTHKFVNARVIDAEIDDENAVHTPFAAPTTVQLEFGLELELIHQLDGEGDGASRELRLDPGYQFHEERLEGESFGRSSED
jgi:hypothetical protein